MNKALQGYHELRDLFCEIVKQQLSNEIEFNIPDGCVAVWGKSDKGIKLPEVAQKALSKG